MTTDPAGAADQESVPYPLLKEVITQVPGLAASASFLHLG